jgi:drug/metabolite transporter (DMT)-like permease
MGKLRVSTKKLLTSFSVKQLTILIYIIGLVVLVPFSDFGLLLHLNEAQLWSLLFCCANTLIAYGAFTKAIEIWDGSKVSAVISISPVFTYIGNKLAVAVAPDIFIDSDLDVYAYLGASLVILGAMTTSIGGKQKVTVLNDSA